MNPTLVARGVNLAASAVLATWFTATTLSQHPNRQFDRLRKYDKTGVAIPNWRFFAPEPCTHDFRILHRMLGTDGAQTQWRETHEIADRRAHQMIWYPTRRRDKAVNDICNELVSLLREPGLDLTVTPAYRVLRNHVDEQIRRSGARPRGFQFLVVADPGHDEDDETKLIFASRFEEWSPRAA